MTHAGGTVPRTQDEELEKGRLLYNDGKFVEAEQYLAGAIDAEKPTITDPQIIAKGRMIRGASDMYVGRKTDAVTQFELILRAIPTFKPNPLDFPPGVLDEFQRTRDRLQKASTSFAEKDQMEQALAAARAANKQLAAQVSDLQAFASQERVVTRHSRVVASIPFGVGQFQNGDVALGAVFATTETLALISAAVSFGFHESIPSKVSDVEGARSVEFSSRFVNWISVASFFGLAIGGVIQANLAFVPESTETRGRPLPQNLRGVRGGHAGLGLRPVVAMPPGGWVVGVGGAF